MRPLCAPHSSRSAELSHSPKAVILRSKPGCDAREGDVQRHPAEDQRFSNTTHSRTGPPAQALSHCFANASGLASSASLAECRRTSAQNTEKKLQSVHSAAPVEDTASSHWLPRPP
jgi:hypothetical protein